MIRTAVIGCGYWGRNLVRNFAELGALRAVVDPVEQVAQKFAAEYAVEALSFDAALAERNIDAVVIAAPAELHTELAVKAFAAGKHVYVEKPIALSVADGEKIVSAAQSAGKTLMVGHLPQYHPAFVKLRELVEAGELGTLRYAYSNRLSTGKFRIEENALWSLAPHDFSMLLALFQQDPVEVIGRGGAFVTPGIEDEYHVDMRFASGARAHVFASWLHPFKEQKLVVVGEKAMAVFEDSEADKMKKLRLYRHGVDYSSRVPEPIKGEMEYVAYDMAAEPLKGECKHFLDSCELGRTPRTDGAEAMRVLRALVAAA